MNKSKKVYLIAFIIFMIGIYGGFFYVLSMMTDVTVLNFYQDYLDTSVSTYVIEAQATNKSLFDLWLFLVVFTVVLYMLKVSKKQIGLKKYLTTMVVIIVSIIISFISINQMITLDALYQVTDTTWPEGYPITAEMLGYVEPSHFFIGNGSTVFSITIICFALFMIAITIKFIKNLKGEKI